jgi:hypothetical protein
MIWFDLLAIALCALLLFRTRQSERRAVEAETNIRKLVAKVWNLMEPGR